LNLLTKIKPKGKHYYSISKILFEVDMKYVPIKARLLAEEQMVWCVHPSIKILMRKLQLRRLAISLIIVLIQ